MKLVEMKCQRCNAVLKVPADTTDISCKYCGANYKLDDEAVHHKIDDAEDLGYKMEKGRQRARKEALDESLSSASEQINAAMDTVGNTRMVKIVSILVIIIFAVAFIGIVAGMIYAISSSKSAHDSFEQAKKEQQQMIEDSQRESDEFEKEAEDAFDKILNGE